MNDIEQTRVLARIRKMLALARDAAATEGERDNALRMAHATMVKHNLDMLEVGAQAVQNDPRGEHQEVYLGKLWARHINQAIAELFFCTYFFRLIPGSNGPAEKNRHCFVGKRSNAMMAIEVSRYIVECTNREATRAQREVGGGFNYHRSFCLGVAIKIHERCQTLRAEGILTTDVPQGPGTAMILASLYQRERQANEELTEAMGLRTGRAGKNSGNSEAMTKGKNYGATVNLASNRTKRIQHS